MNAKYDFKSLGVRGSAEQEPMIRTPRRAAPPKGPTSCWPSPRADVIGF